MALKATVYKVDLQISDMDRHYYERHNLTLARHPSENEARLMVRLLVFALNATPGLSFTKGLSTANEPDLWLKDDTGEIVLWIDLGQPDEKRLRKAAGRAEKVLIYTYSGNSAAIWWEQNQGKLSRYANVSVVDLAEAAVNELAGLAQRGMALQCTVQDGEVWLGDEQHTVHLVPKLLR